MSDETIADQVAGLLATGELLTGVQISVRLGVNYTQVRSRLCGMVRDGRVVRRAGPADVPLFSSPNRYSPRVMLSKPLPRVVVLVSCCLQEKC
ncbi:hypothetical protein ABMA58_00090 [Oceanospirillum sp. HFRX-1_2]